MTNLDVTWRAPSTEAADDMILPFEVASLDLERQNRVIRGGRRRRACWNFDAGIRHDGWIYMV